MLIHSNPIFLLLALVIWGAIIITEPPGIARSWWSGLKPWLSTNLSNLASAINNITNLLNGNLTTLAGVSIYRALLTQTGTDAPEANVLENSLGDIVWTYDNVGTYIGTLEGGFAGTLKPIKETRDGVLLKITKIDSDSVKIETTDLSQETPALADELLSGDFIELIIYPAE